MQGISNRCAPVGQLALCLALGLLMAGCRSTGKPQSGEWFEQRSGVKALLLDIFFVDSQTGFAVGGGKDENDKGVILKILMVAKIGIV